MEKTKIKEEVRITILINKKPYHICGDVITADEIRHLAGADPDYEVWKIVKSPDPEGQLPIDDVQVTGSIEVKSGDKFRVVPPGTFGAVAAMPQQLAQEIAYLRSQGYKIDVHENSGMIILIIRHYNLPPGYNKAATDLLLKIPISYPNGKLDMFWTEPDLRLQDSNGQANTSVENILDRQWLRYSWHPQKWNPGRDNLLTFLQFIDRRLMQLK
jgi:hypothetical protein